MASSYSQFGILRAEQDDVRDAVGYQLRALMVRLHLGVRERDRPSVLREVPKRPRR